MNKDDWDERAAREGIAAGINRFIMGLDSGASNDQLAALLADLRQQEQRLLKGGGTLVDPELWRILHSRLARRGNQDVIDNLG